MSNADGDTSFNINYTKLFVSVVTLSTKGNVKLTKKIEGLI